MKNNSKVTTSSQVEVDKTKSTKKKDSKRTTTPTKLEDNLPPVQEGFIDLSVYREIPLK